MVVTAALCSCLSLRLQNVVPLSSRCNAAQRSRIPILLFSFRFQWDMASLFATARTLTVLLKMALYSTKQRSHAEILTRSNGVVALDRPTGARGPVPGEGRLKCPRMEASALGSPQRTRRRRRRPQNREYGPLHDPVGLLLSLRAECYWFHAVDPVNLGWIDSDHSGCNSRPLPSSLISGSAQS